MELKSIGIGVVVTLLVLASVGAGAVAVTGTSVLGSADQTNTSQHDHSSHSHGDQQSSQQTVSEGDIPEDVKQSIPGAKMLKQNLSESEKFQSANVSIAKSGEVVVNYNSQADNGPALKEEMGQVAIRYSHAVGKHNETGGLTVVANGVKLMVSSDAAIAFEDGKLNQEAYKKTFHWETVESKQETEGSN